MLHTHYIWTYLCIHERLLWINTPTYLFFSCCGTVVNITRILDPTQNPEAEHRDTKGAQLFVQSGQLGKLNKTSSVSPQHFHTLNPPCTPRLAATQPTNLHGIQTQLPFVLRTQSKNGVCHKSGYSFGSRSSSVKSQIPSERGTRVSFLFLNLYIATFTPLAFTDVCNHHHDQDTEQFQHPPTFLPEFGIVGFLFICF